MGLEIEEDKAKHFGLSFAGVLGAYALWRNIGAVVILVLLIGLGKELWDYAGHGVASVGDMTANVLGIAFAVVLIYYLQQKKKDKEKNNA